MTAAIPEFGIALPEIVFAVLAMILLMRSAIFLSLSRKRVR